MFLIRKVFINFINNIKNAPLQIEVAQTQNNH